MLKFEEDDISRTGINGKQIFFTKRINGKTTHNKIASEEESLKINELYKEEPEEIIVKVNKIEDTNFKNEKNTKKTAKKTKKRKQNKMNKKRRPN